MIHLDKNQLKKIKESIYKDGYIVVNNCIDKKIITKIRDSWLETIRDGKSLRKFVRGGLVLGEENFLSFSKIKEWCMYRNFDFLWNTPTDDISTRLCVQVHKIRNKILGKDENIGVSYNKENYGIYISTSLYPSGKGMLEMHSDGHSPTDEPILHYMIPLTFKGDHYERGGLFVLDKKNMEVDVDSLCSPGSLIFFDGRNRHGVKLVEGDGVGRLAMFAVPCFFSKDTSLKVFKRRISTSIFEIKSFIRGIF